MEYGGDAVETQVQIPGDQFENTDDRHGIQNAKGSGLRDKHIGFSSDLP